MTKTRSSDVGAIEKRFDAAMRAREDGEYGYATILLEQLLQLVPPPEPRILSAVYKQLGLIYGFKLGNHERGELFFRKAVEVRPQAEFSSLGLFHCLGEQERWKEALEEAIRFLSLRGSIEYDDLLSDSEFGEGFSTDARELVQYARSLAAQWKVRDST
ncbi:MAG: tetratricopeptide repeat protein [Deltaproteobacteria bacterium]|nr:tetratricopeptide repeat protein [Kofleriaceae bacterium]